MLPNKTILIIDDDNRNIFALSAFLKTRGFTCINAAGAAEGLQIVAERQDIGVILLDMMMPDMDGYEFLSVIREKDVQPQYRIIALTAQAMTGDREKCIAAGADSYISKPVDVDALMRLLTQFL